ncbi:Mft1p KNAG_0E03970 [Huiozyma naganishii CBS 8797]|uniref:Uncharacterized protein n=1 Tax=Huiozyma naganishii (strain ATCC MYA-139 / BCRC 22969 / CBS 8797 / KCTC 17520 / NBRC 10181 / NCYC 3082 / Yp74L-3) TaxID=1071383 RepID=J7R712_HUIN7|nr:hypothetical protein KNAG_0E03970 [Kazachstania naganishii CBS 8797]CCK70650.1 hypothetical protein KNAG_0E03970 [Kazachstania naganishii CBS 8797]
MVLNELQRKRVKSKVLYSELDLPYNRYLDTLKRVSNLTSRVLSGQLDKDDPLNAREIQELKETAQLRFLELQNSIEVMKVSTENWQSNNELSKLNAEEGAKEALPAVKSVHKQLLQRMQAIRNTYDNVTAHNTEIEQLSEGRTTLSVSREQWEAQLGAELTKQLIEKSVLRVDNNSSVEKYRVYGDFSVGLKESKRCNVEMKSDIAKLADEVNLYKHKWLKDANVFSKITAVLQEELTRRDFEDQNMRGDEESQEEESQEEEEDGFASPRERKVDDHHEDFDTIEVDEAVDENESANDGELGGENENNPSDVILDDAGELQNGESEVIDKNEEDHADEEIGDEMQVDEEPTEPTGPVESGKIERETQEAPQSVALEQDLENLSPSPLIE